ncbi:hypothetical protein L1049_013541 [Liquidambar formosana]|uniref:Uncharacterized protein n=1 Tax=Liquidambar formosana TaxID=63359 RepID=A0AAP0RNP4_LIQFO
MNFLITQPKDISCLSADGIILNFSQDDQLVVNLFDNLAKNSSFSRRRCYLSEEFREIEAFYNGSWAFLSRTYFTSPLSSASIWGGVTMSYLASLQTMAMVLPFMTMIGLQQSRSLVLFWLLVFLFRLLLVRFVGKNFSAHFKNQYPQLGDLCLTTFLWGYPVLSRQVCFRTIMPTVCYACFLSPDPVRPHVQAKASHINLVG